MDPTPRCPFSSVSTGTTRTRPDLDLPPRCADNFGETPCPFVPDRLIWLNATGNLDNKDGVTPLFIAALYEDAAGTQPIVAREQRSGNVSRGAEAPISR